MKKTLWGILILVALTGCDGKNSNSDPKYAGIDDTIEKIIDTMNDNPASKNLQAGLKIQVAEKMFFNIVFAAPMILSENCTEEKLSASYSDLIARNIVNKQQFDGIKAIIPFACENGVYKKEKYDAESQVLYSYAKKKFTDEFVEK